MQVKEFQKKVNLPASEKEPFPGKNEEYIAR